jgi:hypothetical protein
VDKGQIDVREAYLRATDKNAIVQGLLSRGHDASFAEGAGAASNAAAGPGAGTSRPAPMGRANATAAARPSAAGVGRQR